MKILIVYYSRSGITKNVANILKEKLDADIEEITDNNKYSGAIGWLKGGFNASTGRLSEINPISKNPLHYDLTIIGSPVWASNIATPVATFINKNYKDLTKVAGFVTCGSGGGEKALEKMSEECEKQLEATMILTSKDIENDLDKKINTFIDKLKL
ncbi:MAG: flavodoxin [Methanobrevibacter sp.]|uniref:flavodoxin family protein n=1 Tax=Methanobrevibacter sp. TaxID=66852 RepID=UPI0026E0B949|nr:flavodoxin [Methanobrevibacter sp.]MDO5848964.1 flavodoxin [Methanobrevibacter sp.]